MGNFLDLTGRRFGRLTALRREGRNRHGKYQWLCACDCGTEVQVVTGDLRSGNTTSCGCARQDAARRLNLVHGLSTDEAGKRTRLYRIWRAMRRRCSSENDTAYHRYGGRGIRVCPEWDAYEAFHSWATSNGYADDLEIDRIDNDGDYEPSNCRWLSRPEQMRNVSINRELTLGGRSQCVSEWAEELGMPVSTLTSRLRRGWSEERALTEPTKAMT